MPNTAYRSDTLELERLFQRSAQERALAEVEARMRLENKLDSFIVDTQGNFNRFDDKLGHADDKLNNFITETKESFKRVDENFKRVDENFKRVDERLEQMAAENKENLKRIEEKFDGKFERLEGKLDSFKIWAIGIIITVVIAAVGMIVSTFAQ